MRCERCGRRTHRQLWCPDGHCSPRLLSPAMRRRLADEGLLALTVAAGLLAGLWPHW